MLEPFKSWALAIVRLWWAEAIDWSEAARLATEIASHSTDDILRLAAGQAIPILRGASADGADYATTQAARRRLAIVLDVLHELATPRFGRRDGAPKPLTVEQQARKMLGLPLDRPLANAEIHQAFRHAAKIVHPDAGGSANEFLELSAARDALVSQPVRHR